MANRDDLDIDDDFSDLYKEYTGPSRTSTTNAPETVKTNKRSLAGSDEEEEARDPNAVPTDFTSREAKTITFKMNLQRRRNIYKSLIIRNTGNSNCTTNNLQFFFSLC